MKLPLLKRPDPSATGETVAVKKRPALKKLGRKKLIALVAAAALVIGLGSHTLLGGSAQAAKTSDGGYTTAQVTRRDVTATITGSGTLEAADSYNVTTLLEDTILTANFEEGDQVEEGTVLYTLDASDADSSLEQSEISLQQAQRSYSRQLEDQADLNVAATAAGQVWSVDVEVGDEIQAGQTVATIRDSATMELKVPFPTDDAASFSLGQSATVTLDSTFESVRNAQINLENRYEQLDDYTITSPIKGTIIDKNYNAGETTEANKTLCTIYDLSYLTMTLSVDELDISNISVGQTVSITADAVEDQTYTGTVTKVSVAGTSTGSATTYPVTIRIDETDGLLPGMSVDATIELQHADNVLVIPAAALNRGNTVLVTKDSPSAANAQTAQPSDSQPSSDQPDGSQPQAPDTANSDYVSVQVTTGVSDGDYIEITSGLQEGDTVAYIQTSSSGGMDMMMGGMPGGGGGMPGGSGGGMPGGGGAPGGF